MPPGDEQRLSDSEIADRIREETGAQGRVPISAVEQVRERRQEVRRQRQEARQSLRSEVVSQSPGVTEDEVTITETEDGFEAELDPSVEAVQGVEGVDDDLLNAALPENQTSEIQDFEQALDEAGPEVRQEFDDVIRDFEEKRQEFKEGVSETFTEADPEDVASSTEDLLEITNDLDSEDVEQDLEEFGEEAESERQVEVAEDLVGSAADAFDEDSIDTAVGNIDRDADEVTAVAEEIARDEEEVDRLEEQLRESIQNQELGLQQQQEEDTEPDTGFEAPGPEVRQATRNLRERVSEETGLDEADVRIDQTTEEDGTVRLEARAADGATVTETAQNNDGSPAEETRQELREIDQLLPDQETTEDDRTLAEDAVAAGVEGIRFSESVGEDVAEQADLTEGSPAGPNPLGLASRTIAAGSDLAQGEPRQAAASALPFIESSEEAEVTETVETGVVSGPGQLASFGVGATGATVQATANTLGQGDGPGVIEAGATGAGLIAQQARENPREFAVSEISEEIGEGVFTAGVGAAVPTVTPEITPSPSLEAETPTSIQEAERFIRGDLGERVTDEVDVTQQVDPELTEEAETTIASEELEGGGQRLVAEVPEDGAVRRVVQERQPVTRREAASEFLSDAASRIGDAATNTRRGELRLEPPSQSTEPEVETEPEVDTNTQPGRPEELDPGRPDTAIPDTFTTPTQRPTLDQVQSPIQNPVQEPFQTPSIRQRPETTPEVREETTVTPDQRTEIVPEQTQTPFIEQVPEQTPVVEQERRPEPEPEPEPERRPSPDFGLGEDEDEEELFGFEEEEEEGDGEFTTSLVGESFGVGVTEEQVDSDDLTGLEGRIR